MADARQSAAPDRFRMNFNPARFVAEHFPLATDLLTRRLARTVTAAAVLVFAVNIFAFAYSIATATGDVTFAGEPVGGDFVVFDTAAEAARKGGAAEIYNPRVFRGLLANAIPAHDSTGMSWQYPPTILLLILPLAFAPFLASYVLWAGATGALYFAAASRVWKQRLAIFLVVAAPAAFQALITGQTSFLAAALFIIAASQADRRAILAGVAAGLLTVKPQLGLLIPIAFAASGCWRAFGAAAATAALLAAASIAAFGLEPWFAFLDATATQIERMQPGVFPFEKLVTVYGGAMMLGAPTTVALAAQAAAFLGLAGFVAFVWRRVEARDLRLAVLCAAALLATPYAFYYEMIVALPALLVVARRGVETGWLKGEKFTLAVLWLAPMFIFVLSDGLGFPAAFAASLGTFLLAARRAMRPCSPSAPQL